MPVPTADRLIFRRVAPADAAALHALATDPHVRRYLLDGEVVPPSWADEEIRASDALFASRGVGLWLVQLRDTPEADAPLGLCGYKHFPDLHADDPELLYAFPERFTGRGLATEVAHALVAFARDHAGFTSIVSAVDEPNAASVRVLEKVGFRATGVVPGAFERIVLFHLD